MLIHSFAEDVEDESVLTRVRHPIRRTSLIIAWILPARAQKGTNNF